jgi:hypothetical protein
MTPAVAATITRMTTITTATRTGTATRKRRSSALLLKWVATTRAPAALAKSTRSAAASN